MFKKLITTTASIVAFSVAIFPLSPVSAIGGATKAFVFNDACMARFLNGRPFGILRAGLYPYLNTTWRRLDGEPLVVLRVYPRPYRQVDILIPLGCVQNVRGRVIEH